MKVGAAYKLQRLQIASEAIDDAITALEELIIDYDESRENFSAAHPRAAYLLNVVQLRMIYKTLQRGRI
ncbi:hypothetical protein [Kosakonia sp. 1610]|uniref:hypothetical protein n=1 Tax=Kosakonia sp. 1610 TaxID=3156426 RepID=UPI003D203705